MAAVLSSIRTIISGNDHKTIKDSHLHLIRCLKKCQTDGTCNIIQLFISAVNNYGNGRVFIEGKKQITWAELLQIREALEGDILEDASVSYLTSNPKDKQRQTKID